jgi:hypothetical protein
MWAGLDTPSDAIGAAIWTGIATVVSGLIVLWGARYTARATKRASEYTSLLNAPETISTGYARLTRDLWANINDLRTRVSNLEHEATVQETKYRAAIAYIRTLLSFVTLHVPQHPIPMPPKDLAADVVITPSVGKDG